MDRIHLRIHDAGKAVTRIGWWVVPDERMDNFAGQQDLGWHVMYALRTGAELVEAFIVSEEEADGNSITNE